MECRQKTAVVGFKSRTLVVGGELQVENNSDWLQMENSGGPSKQNDNGKLQMENYSNGPQKEKKPWWASNGER